MQSPKASSILCLCAEAIVYRGSNANANCPKSSNSSNAHPQDHCHFTMHLDPKLGLCCGKLTGTIIDASGVAVWITLL